MTSSRMVPRWSAGFLAAGLVAAGSYFSRLAPPWPEAFSTSLATGLVGAGAFAAARWLPLPSDPGEHRRSARRWVFLFLLTLGCYLGLWLAFSYRISFQGHRVLGSWAYSDLAEKYLALNALPLPSDKVLADMENDPDLVFAPASLTIVRGASLGTWFAACGAGFFLLGGILLAGERDPRLARLAARIESWPPQAEPWRTLLLRALATLQDAGNPAGAVLAAAGIFEGREGLLGVLAASHGRTLKAALLIDQIEESAGQGRLPKEIASDLHWIRVRSNVARHRQHELVPEDAYAALERSTLVVEWYLKTGSVVSE